MALVDNALKFSPKGGAVELRLGETPDGILVAVEDHGIGIAKENMPRIFDRFYHLEKHEDDLFGGIGLGLAITKSAIQLHGGQISATNAAGGGLEIKLTLPVK